MEQKDPIIEAIMEAVNFEKERANVTPVPATPSAPPSRLDITIQNLEAFHNQADKSKRYLDEKVNGIAEELQHIGEQVHALLNEEHPDKQKLNELLCILDKKQEELNAIRAESQKIAEEFVTMIPDIKNVLDSSVVIAP